MDKFSNRSVSLPFVCPLMALMLRIPRTGFNKEGVCAVYMLGGVCVSHESPLTMDGGWSFVKNHKSCVFY